MGLSPDEFWGLTLRDYMTKVEGYYHNREQNEELLRRAVFYITAPYHKDGTKPVDFWTLKSEAALKRQIEAKEAEKAELAFAKVLGVKPQ